MDKFELEKVIKKIKDFPKKGILFYDITPILLDYKAFNFCIEWFYEKISKMKIDTIIAIESRGFIFGSVLAHKLNIKLILARKPNKLPRETISEKYDLEYGFEELFIHKEDIVDSKNIAIIDDLIATGGTISCCSKLLSKVNKKITMVAAIINIKKLNNLSQKDFIFDTLIEY